MLLAINVGNTNTRFGLCEAGAVVASVRVPNTAYSGAADLLRPVRSGLGLDRDDKIAGICVGSVVPARDAIIRELCETAFPGVGVPLLAHSALDVGMNVCYRPVGALGADRFANAFAARCLYGAPVIVIDLGTATTIEAVDSHGDYLGGAILPGVAIGRDALAQRTAKLGSVSLDGGVQVDVVGTDTASAIRAGLLHGTGALIDGMVERFRREPGLANAPVVATGGLSSVIEVYTRAFTTRDDDLTLKGLALIYDRIRCG